MKFLLATNYGLAMDPFVWPEPQNLKGYRALLL